MQEPDVCLEDDIDASVLLEIEEGKRSLPLTGGKVHRGNVFVVVNDDLYSGEGTKFAAQQIHVLEMRVGVRRAHHEFFLAVDLNEELAWNRVGSKQLVTCL